MRHLLAAWWRAMFPPLPPGETLPGWGRRTYRRLLLGGAPVPPWHARWFVSAGIWGATLCVLGAVLSSRAWFVWLGLAWGIYCFVAVGTADLLPPRRRRVARALGKSGVIAAWASVRLLVAEVFGLLG